MRIKKLYRYNDIHWGKRKPETHTLTKDCQPYIELTECENTNRQRRLWRCRCDQGDFIGYATLAEAREEEIENTYKRLADDNKWIKELTKK